MYMYLPGDCVSCTMLWIRVLYSWYNTQLLAHAYKVSEWKTKKWEGYNVS